MFAGICLPYLALTSARGAEARRQDTRWPSVLTLFVVHRLWQFFSQTVQFPAPVTTKLGHFLLLAQLSGPLPRWVVFISDPLY
jgi:hypothetical protein